MSLHLVPPNPNKDAIERRERQIAEWGDEQDRLALLREIHDLKRQVAELNDAWRQKTEETTRALTDAIDESGAAWAACRVAEAQLAEANQEIAVLEVALCEARDERDNEAAEHEKWHKAWMEAAYRA